MSLIQVEHCGFVRDDEVIIVSQVGKAYTVYLDSPSFHYVNCVGPGNLDAVHPDLHRFRVGGRYKIVRTDHRYAWLLDLAVPQYMRIPKGV